MNELHRYKVVHFYTVLKKSIDEIYAVSDERAEVVGVVIYVDKFGYILADKSRRGIYVYEKNPKLPIIINLLISVSKAVSTFLYDMLEICIFPL